MSSFDSAINALNHTTCIDLLRLNPDDPKSGTWARGLAVAWGGCAGFAGLLAAWGGKTLLIQALYFTSLFTGPLLALITMAFSNLIGLNARCYGEPVSAW
jgi:SSS family solute:Na+ symporter